MYSANLHISGDSYRIHNVRSLLQATKFGLHNFQENAGSVHYTGVWDIQILYVRTHKIKTTCAFFGKEKMQLRNKKNLQNNMQIKQGTGLCLLLHSLLS